MAHTKSSKKRVRQNEAKRLHNRELKGRMRTAVKAVESKIGSDDAEGLDAAFRKASSEIDKAGRKRLIHPKAASRQKSRLAKQLAKTSQS
jgi:small subunit ribosomal protein S20